MPRKRDNGIWYTDVYVDNPLKGKKVQVRKSLGRHVKSRRAAANAENELVRDLQATWAKEAERRASGGPAKKSAAFSGFAKMWLDTYIEVDRKSSVTRAYTSICRTHLVPAFGDRDMRTITREDVQAFKVAQTKKVVAKTGKLRSPKTINNELGALSSMFTMAVELGYADHNPCRKVANLRVPEQDFDFYDAAETEVFLAAGRKREPRWSTLYLLGFRSGLRMGEMAGLDIGDLDFRSQKIHVRRSYTRGSLDTPKGGKSRVVDMTDDLAMALEIHCAGRAPSEPVFVARKGGRINRDMVKHGWERVIAISGLRRITPHDMRHSFASQLVMLAAPLKVVQELLGHAKLETTMRYAHLTPDFRARFVAQLGQPNKHKSSTVEDAEMNDAAQNTTMMVEAVGIEPTDATAPESADKANSSQ